MQRLAIHDDFGWNLLHAVDLDVPCRTDVLVPAHVITETSVPVAGGTGWLLGDPSHYDRDFCLDLVQLRGFLLATQPDTLEALALGTDGPTRRKFLARVQRESHVPART